MHRLAGLLFLASLGLALGACTAAKDTGVLVRDTGDLLYKDTATDSFDGRYASFNQFLNRVSKACDRYPVGSDTISTLIQSDSNMIDALSRLFEGKITRGDFSAFIGGWYAGTDSDALSQCVFAQLPAQTGSKQE